MSGFAVGAAIRESLKSGFWPTHLGNMILVVCDATAAADECRLQAVAFLMSNRRNIVGNNGKAKHHLGGN
ncbi:MAG: hypothetical protein U5K75_10445, partial [Ahrensia sp.]|nr:hypothetical protein [Ahrensia sp.]